MNNHVVKNDDVSLVLNELGLHALGYALPIGVPYNYVPTVANGERAQMEGSKVSGLNEMKAQAPLTLRRENGEAYVFALDPMISVSWRNVITRRYVAKGGVKGTVKESWSQDDYEITISGVLIGSDGEELNEMVRALREVCESGETLKAENDWLLDGFGVTQLVVESCQMPHTKGVANQTYTIKCYSDDSMNVLEEVQ